MEKRNYEKEYKKTTTENIAYLKRKLENQDENKKLSLLEISLLLKERKKIISSFVRTLFGNRENIIGNNYSNKANYKNHVNCLV